jgi:hypothetical protein
LPKALILILAAILPRWHLWHKPFLCCDYCCVRVRPTLCCCSVDKAVPVPDGTADVVDVLYVNIVTWSMGCVGVGEAAKGEQLIANQGQEWMGILTTSKKAGSPSK